MLWVKLPTLRRDTWIALAGGIRGPLRSWSWSIRLDVGPWNRSCSLGISIGLELDLALSVEEVPEPYPSRQLTHSRTSSIAWWWPHSNHELTAPRYGHYFLTSVPLQSPSFSAAEDTALERFNIVRKGLLYLQPEDTLRDAIIASRIVGCNKLCADR